MLLVSRGPCVALLLCVSLLGCARNPVSGRPEVVLVSRAQEVEIGRAEARKVEESMGLVDDPELQAWVGQLGARLAGRSPRQDVAYRFAVVDVAEPNAFALPGGYVYVSRGLLVLVNDTDELAAVLGHEIGHVAARHSVRRLTVAAPFALATGIPALLTGLVSPSLGETLAETGRTTGGLVLAPYGRGQERDADRIGMEIAAGAGYDPKALARFLATLEREEVAAGTARDRTSWLDSHPATPERRRDAERRAQKLSDAARPETPDGRSEVLARLDGLVVGPDPSGGLFVEGRFLHPGL
ncbi:MAG: M48 family metalloprotease, partial [Myxococcota bacterium]